MHRLQFNPEPLLAFFMTKENAGSLAGDLEERFHRDCRRKGRMRAAVWFWWALLASIPPIIIETLKSRRSAPFVTAGPSSSGILSAEEPDESDSDTWNGDVCRTWSDCLGTIRWDVEDGHGGHAGHCPQCGAFHVSCGNCGAVSFYDGHQVRCDGCETRWEFEFEDYEVVEMRCLTPGVDEDGDATVADTAMLER